MEEVSFEEAIEFIRAKDPRYQAEAYSFVREALDYTQKNIARDKAGTVRHVTGQELLTGIRDFALAQFGPMAMMLLNEWGVQNCQDFGEIVFNMVECGGAPEFSPGDIKLEAFATKLRKQADPVSEVLWRHLSEDTQQALQLEVSGRDLERVLLRDLNQVLHRVTLYDERQFANLKLSEQTRILVTRKLAPTHRPRVNRLLLEDVYPAELAKSGGLLARTDKDSRADFRNGYDFFEAFRRPFLPSNGAWQREATVVPSSEN